MATFIKNQFHQTQIAKSFNKIASVYDQVALLPHEVARRLVERLNYIKLQPQTIIDLGSGTGFCTQLIQQQYPDATLLAMDLSIEMLSFAKKKATAPINYICSDAYQLPLPDHSIDLIVSNLMLPWCDDLKSLFQELHRVIRPDGLLMFATLGPDTLLEMRNSWLQIDNSPHVQQFIDMHDIGDELLRAHFSDPVVDAEKIQLVYPRVELILQDLMQMGSKNRDTTRQKGMMGKSHLKQFYAAYNQYQLADGQFPATCEVIYGHAWRSNIEAGANVDSAGNVSISIDHLRRMIRR